MARFIYMETMVKGVGTLEEDGCAGSDNGGIVGSDDSPKVHMSTTPYLSATEKKVLVDKDTCGSPMTVKNGLTEGETYRLKTVEQVKTRFGSQQLWTMESKLSKVVSKIWPPGVLTKYTTDNGDDLDSWGVDILKSLEIKYTGYSLGPDNKPRYGFLLADPTNPDTTGGNK